VSSFTLPPDGELFTQQILERCSDLIISGIWEGLTQIRLDTWMTNFVTPTEEYFAASVLDALIFRSERQTVSLMETMFQRALPDLLRRQPQGGISDNSWLDVLRAPSWQGNPYLRIVPVIKRDDPPAKSGPALCRLYRRFLSLEQDWMIWPWRISQARAEGITRFLFIDDFLGTGDQFCDFAQHFKLSTHLKHCFGVYAPLVAHKGGISHLAKKLKALHITAVEIIDNSYNLFADDSLWFCDGINSPTTARSFYDILAKRARLPIDPEAMRGYGKLSLAYAFNHATPDNCLPLLWMEGPEWKPLLDR